MIKIKTIIVMLLLCNYIHAGVVICSIPKCGSNLVKALLEELGYSYKGNLVDRSYLRLSEQDLTNVLGNEGCTITHAIPTQENIDILRKTGHKAIFIYRDPRDQIVSCANYMKCLDEGKFWIAGQLSMEDLISELIVNYKIKGETYKKGLWTDEVFDDMGSVVDFYHMYLPWLDCPNVYCTSFEKLVGSKGGGSDIVQYQEISNICNYLGIENSPGKISYLCNNLFGNEKSWTFHKGLIGRWKDSFSEDQKILFNRVASSLLNELGY